MEISITAVLLRNQIIIRFELSIHIDCVSIANSWILNILLLCRIQYKQYKTCSFKPIIKLYYIGYCLYFSNLINALKRNNWWDVLSCLVSSSQEKGLSGVMLIHFHNQIVVLTCKHIFRLSFQTGMLKVAWIKLGLVLASITHKKFPLELLFSMTTAYIGNVCGKHTVNPLHPLIDVLYTIIYCDGCYMEWKQCRTPSYLTGRAAFWQHRGSDKYSAVHL